MASASATGWNTPPSEDAPKLSAETRKSFNELYHSQFTGKLQKMFQDGIEHGEFRALDPPVATWALLGIMYPYFYPSATGAKPVNPETIQQIVGIFMSGVIKTG